MQGGKAAPWMLGEILLWMLADPDWTLAVKVVQS